MKFIKKILPLMLCLCMLFCAACGNNPDNGGTPSDEPATHTLTVTDNSGNPVANAWFEVFYYADAAEFGELTVVAKAKTDTKGIASFVIKDSDKTYIARVAEFGEKASAPSLDYRYKIDEANSSLTFDSEGKATAKLTYSPSRFPGNNTPRIQYSREYVDGEISSVNAAYSVEVKSGTYEYFCFAPYISPAVARLPGESDNDYSARLNEAISNAQTAASGMYELTYSVEPADANVTMYKYIGSRANMFFTDAATGIPNFPEYITGNAPANAEDTDITLAAGAEPEYTGTNSITLDVTMSITSSDYIFGIKADRDCTVTVTVGRIGEATVERKPTITEKHATKGLAAWTDADVSAHKSANDDFVAIPYNGSATTVLGEDNYYHVGTANGPILYAVLTKTTRAGDAIQKWPSIAPAGNAIFTYPSKEDEYVRYDFLELVKTYCKLANNTYGVYPVTEELKEFLTYLGGNIGNDPNYEYWLMPCKYFGTMETGTPLNEGQNTITLTAQECSDGKLYTITSEQGGRYKLTATDNNVQIWTESPNDPVIGIIEEKFVGIYTPIVLEAGKSFNLYFGYAEAGQDASYTVTLQKLPD